MSAPVVVEESAEQPPVVKLNDLQNLLKKPSASLIETSQGQSLGPLQNSSRYAEKEDKIRELSNMVKQLVAE